MLWVVGRGKVEIKSVHNSKSIHKVILKMKLRNGKDRILIC